MPNEVFLVDGAFRVRIDEKPPILRDVVFDASVDEVTGWLSGEARTPAEFEPFLKIMIKWDSCSHVWYGDGDGDAYLHLCGVADFVKHARLMKELYELAFQHMGRAPQEGESWPESA